MAGNAVVSVNRPQDAEGADTTQRVLRLLPTWLLAAVAVLVILVSAASGAVAATVIVRRSETSGRPVPAAPPSAAQVHDANVKLCTLYFSASNAMANWTETHPSDEQRNGTTGASVYITTGHFLMWAITQAPDADQGLRDNIRATAQAVLDTAALWTAEPSGLIQPPTSVPNSAINTPSRSVLNFCDKGR